MYKASTAGLPCGCLLFTISSFLTNRVPSHVFSAYNERFGRTSQTWSTECISRCDIEKIEKAEDGGFAGFLSVYTRRIRLCKICICGEQIPAHPALRIERRQAGATRRVGTTLQDCAAPQSGATAGFTP
jgi:hypothetical protein